MRKIAVLLIMSAVLSVSQDQQPKPRLSKDPLSDEQVEVYRTFLRSYLNGDDAQSLNIANVTVPLNEEPGELKEGKGCLKGISLENFKGANSTVHLLPQAVAINSGIHLVDPDKQNEQVKANDPGLVIQKDPGHADIDTAVKNGFSSGLFTFSEIAFDKNHRWAVLSYSFYCGSLCGHGSTIVLHKVNKEWKTTKRNCGGWIS